MKRMIRSAVAWVCSLTLLAGMTAAADFSAGQSNISLRHDQENFQLTLKLSETDAFAGAEILLQSTDPNISFDSVSYGDNLASVGQVASKENGGYRFGFFTGENKLSGNFTMTISGKYTGTGSATISLADADIIRLNNNGMTSTEDQSPNVQFSLSKASKPATDGSISTGGTTSGGTSTGGSSGASGGNSASKPTQKPDSTLPTPTPSQTNPAAVSTPVTSTVTGNSATATVTQETVEKALQEAVSKAKETGASASVILQVDAPTTATEVKAELPKTALESLSSQNSALTVSSPVGDVSLPSAVLQSIAERAGGAGVTVSVQIRSAESLRTEQQAVLGKQSSEAVILDLSISSGESTISNLGGTATISLPCTHIDTERLPQMVVWFLADDGSISPCAGSYNEKTGKFDFETTHFSAYALVEFPFSDIPQDVWYYGGTAYCYTNHLMQGTSKTEFSPQMQTSRGMLMTVLARIAGEDTSGAEPWYTLGMDWAKAHGISDGTMPEGNLTREQMVTMLWRYAEGEASQSDSLSLSNYTDAQSVSAYAKDAMVWAIEHGIINGTSDTSLSPQGTASRDQFSVILQRFLQGANES